MKLELCISFLLFASTISAIPLLDPEFRANKDVDDEAFDSFMDTHNRSNSVKSGIDKDLISDPPELSQQQPIVDSNATSINVTSLWKELTGRDLDINDSERTLAELFLSQSESDWNETNGLSLSRERRNSWDKLMNAGTSILGSLSNTHLGTFLHLVKGLFGTSTPQTLLTHGHDYNSAGSDTLTYDILRSMLAVQQIHQGNNQEKLLEEIKHQEERQEVLLEDLKSVEMTESANISQASTYELIIAILLACLLGVFIVFCLLLLCKVRTAG